MRTYTHADLAAAWDDGFNWCYDDGGLAQNPYRDEETAARVQPDDGQENYMRADLISESTGGSDD